MLEGNERGKNMSDLVGPRRALCPGMDANKLLPELTAFRNLDELYAAAEDGYVPSLYGPQHMPKGTSRRLMERARLAEDLAQKLAEMGFLVHPRR